VGRAQTARSSWIFVVLLAFDFSLFLFRLSLFYYHPVFPSSLLLDAAVAVNE
jgi:hypothetical protein